MKKFYYPYLTAFYIFLVLFMGINEAKAQVIVPFKERTSSYSPTRTIYKIKGDFTMIGNINLTTQNYDRWETNGDFPMIYVDKDNNNQTVNSSSATLDLLNDHGAKLTNCYNIVYAGLYWTGRIDNATNSPSTFTVNKNGTVATLDKRKILFKGPNNGNYDEFTATDIYFPTNSENNIFTAYTEVTDYVKANGVGEYFAANIAATEGADGGAIGKYAGWGLVVVYENSDMKNRDITVFDGHAFVQNNITADHSFSVSGFNSIASGPVDVKLGIMAGEGDVNYNGDYFKIQKLNSNDYLSLSHSENSPDNFFNSSINTGGNYRNPNLENNSGMDISMFKLPNENKDIIGNNQTSTTFRYGSTVDTYVIFSIVMAVDAYVPEIEGIISATTINGSPAGAGPYTVLPGQELGYKVQIQNRGTEAIQNSKLVIPIPYNATFVNGSLAKTINFTPAPSPNSLTYEPTIGANGSIVWDLGTLPLPTDPNTVLGELTFTLKSTENCALLKNSNCSNVIQVDGKLSGKGVNSSVTVSDHSLILGYTPSGNCTGSSIAAPLQTTIDSANYTNANCQATPPTIAFTFCNSASSIPVTDVTGSFPTGSTFYNAYPVVAGTTTQYTINNPFPATVGTSTYYAIPPGASSGCYFAFTITIESITTTPTVTSPINYCIGDTPVALTAVPTKPEYTLYYYETLTSTGQQSLTPSTAVAGQYTYYVAEGKTNACIGPKKEIIVNVNEKPTVTITNPLPICSPATSVDLTTASITTGSSSGLTYTYWTDATATTPYSNFAAAVPGTYYIKGTNASNCFDIKPVVVTKSTVTVTELIASHVDVKCFNQATGSITVENASGGVAPYTYSWKKNGAAYAGTSQTLTNLEAGSYEVTAMDSNGCQGTLVITISQPTGALALAASSKTDVSCFGKSTGTLTAGTVTNAIGTVKYSWKDNTNAEISTSANVTDMPAGTYTLTVTDDCSSASNSVTIGQPAAILSAIKSQTNVSCGNGNNGSATVTVSGGTPAYTYVWNTIPAQTTATATNLTAGNYSVKITDANGCEINESFTILDGDSIKPIINPLPQTTTINCPAEPVFAQATATDDSGTVTSLTYVDDTVSGNCAGSYTKTRTWTAQDACGNVSLPVTQTIIVQDITAPTWTTLAGSLDKTVECNDAAALANAQALFPTATDSCDADVTNIVKVSGQFTASAGCTNAGTYTNTWTVKDDCGNTSDTFTQIITIQDTTAPIWTTLAGSLDKTVECNDAAALANAQALLPTATDSCDADVTNIVKVSGQFTASAGCGNAGTYTNTWTVKDDCGNASDTFTQIITIQDTTAPIWTTLAGSLDKTVECSDAAALANAQALFPAASDSCDADVNNIVKVSGQFTASAGCGNAGTYTNTWTVKDDCGNASDTFTQIITIQDTTAPTWTTLAGSLDKTVECSDAAALANAQALFPTASDSCDADVTNIVKVSGQFTASAGCGNAGTYTNTWTVKDDCGNVSNTFTQVITIQDTTAPLFTGNLPQNVTVSCDAIPEVAEMTASDNCNGNLPIVFSETKSDIQNGCASNYTLTRTWKTSDCGGNVVSYTQIITVRDTKAPTGTAPANVTNLASVDLIPVGSPADIKDAADNCSPTVNITVTDTNNGCDGNVYILTRTYTLTDCAGNKRELVQTFTVNCKPKKVIIANDDAAGPIAGVNHTTTNVLNVFSNDTLDGVIVTPSDVILTTITPNAFLQLNPNGSIDVLPNAPVGTLTLVYQICEANQTDNCDTATVTITIEAPKITVSATPICVNDVPYIDYVVTAVNFTPVNGVTIAWADSNNNIISTMNNLPLSGRVLWPGAVVDGNGKGIDWPGWIFENNKWVQGADGFEKLRPTAILTLTLNPSETITVNYPPSDPYCTARPTFAIIANNDTAGPINGATGANNIINVLTNDTLNGSAVNLNDITLTTTIPDPKGALTLNSDGSVNVAPNTPAGTYTLTYQICEKADFGNCATAVVTVTVTTPSAPPTPVVANDDTYSNIGCNTFGLVGNVLSNDVKGTTPVTLELVNFTLLNDNNSKTDPNITISNTGNVTVSSLTPAGTYTYSYRICDKLSSENCDTAIVTITVVPNGTTQFSSTACTDDSSLINLTSLLPEGSPTTGTWIDRSNTNSLQGNIFNPFGLALGNYVLEYQIAGEKCPRNIILNMEVNDDCKVLACEEVFPHNAFSPNGDNFNDTFKIDNIDNLTCYPENTVEIYNRWGILVFETKNYNNTTNAFDGISRGRTTVKQSDGLPTGTYFYIIHYKSLDGNNNLQDNKLSGYLYLSK
ncbi:gliding motility-associated-like protein [Flavobacterium nitrogenifigens]|uniref:Gliding motility-associated-like protein n=2 Tax=Flavobacterium TaxID=237 RepID=A0A7W7N8G3_9FLAO|nr:MULTISPECIES: gliding motility-associated C-terminal domain-containing protein [Flavobacterium]MBB4802426.1 gliding motility-associated-like protein [Flavobacterium nitrogenifigens]MBB6387384.1 gliding motility-associated-like protein [Flavobacterium notoginsengisoli]